MPVSSLGRPRPRPVADAPALDGAEVAKAWLVELVAVAPLEHAARLPGARFAEDAPRLCAAIAAALCAEGAFDDLEPGGGLAPLAAGAAELAAAGSPLAVVRALEALRAVTWAALLEGLDRASPAQVGELADRLAAVVAAVTSASLDTAAGALPARPGDRGPLAAVLRSGEAEPGPEPNRDPHPEPGPDPDPVPREAPLPDELRDLAATLRAAAAAPDPLARLRELAHEAADTVSAAAERLRQGAGPAVADAAEFRAARIAPWTAAIERRVARHRQDGSPFAVLCIEVADLDRLVAADRDADVKEALEAAEAAVCGRLRPADALIREQPGRYWLTAPDTDATEARALAHRIAAAVAETPEHRGTPLQAAIGVAACPTDAADTPSLEGRAEEGLFAARAAGLRVAGPSA